MAEALLNFGPIGGGKFRAFSAGSHPGGKVNPLALRQLQPMTAHWGIADPAAVEGTADVKDKAFRDTLIHLRRRIELFAALPLASLTRLALQERLDQIGRT
jgi:arsenate reductase